MQHLDIAPSVGTQAMAPAWMDAVHHKLEQWMAHPGLYRLALSNPFTRWFAQRRTRQIFDLMSGFVYSQVLLSCVRLKLFALLHNQLLTDGIILNKGTIVDASFVNVPRQRNSREENNYSCAEMV